MNLKTPFILLRWLVLAVIALVALVFALKNNHPSTLYFLMNYQWQAPLSLLMLISLGIGFLIGFSAGGMSLFRMMRWREKKLKHKWDKASSPAAPTEKKLPPSSSSETAAIPLLPSA